MTRCTSSRSRAAESWSTPAPSPLPPSTRHRSPEGRGHDSSTVLRASVAASAIVVTLSPVAAERAGEAGVPANGAAKPAAAEPAKRSSFAELWVHPGTSPSATLFYGPGGPRIGADPQQEFEVTGRRHHRLQRRLHRDSTGRAWDVKIGIEAQPEVVAQPRAVADRLPPARHALPPDVAAEERTRAASSCRRASACSRTTRARASGPGARTRSRHAPAEGSRRRQPADEQLGFQGQQQSHLHVPRNGDRSRHAGSWCRTSARRSASRHGRSATATTSTTSNRSVSSGRRGRRGRSSTTTARHREVLEDITPADVVWACRLLDRITDKQWADVFRAAAYPPDIAARYRRAAEVEDRRRPGAGATLPGLVSDLATRVALGGVVGCAGVCAELSWAPLPRAPRRAQDRVRPGAGPPAHGRPGRRARIDRQPAGGARSRRSSGCRSPRCSAPRSRFGRAGAARRCASPRWCRRRSSWRSSARSSCWSSAPAWPAPSASSALPT